MMDLSTVFTILLMITLLVGPLAAASAVAMRFGADSRPGADDVRPWLSVGR